MSVTPPTQTIVPTMVPSSSWVGTPTVTPLAQTIVPTMVPSSSWVGTPTVTLIASVATVVESASPADWAHLQELAHALSTLVLEQAAAGALDITDAGPQAVLGVIIWGLLLPLKALMSRP